MARVVGGMRDVYCAVFSSRSDKRVKVVMPPAIH